MNQDASLAIVVASCDKYADLWLPVVSQLNINWPDCPYNFYIVGNEQRRDFKNFKQLLVGQDRDWSTTMKAAIEQIDEDYVLFWLDDVFLNSKVDTQEIKKHFAWVVENKVDFLRLRANPRPEKYQSGYGRLGVNASYRVSIFATIWHRKKFLDVVIPGESAWEFELNGTERSKVYSNFFAVERSVFRYRHGVEKGKWLVLTYRWLRSSGYELSGREIMTKKETFYAAVRKGKSITLDLFPESRRKSVIKAANFLYKILGVK